MNRLLLALAALVTTGAVVPCSPALAQQALVVTPLAERTVEALPAGELYWRIETFDTRDGARSAASAWALVVEDARRVWLFTLGPAGGASTGGTKVAEVGPIPRVTAPAYLLRINEATGPPGSTTPVHMHPGSEAYFVLDGEQRIRSAHGVQVVKAGQPEARHGAGMAMQVASSGAADLRALVMFVVDATKPFSSPATFR